MKYHRLRRLLWAFLVVLLIFQASFLIRREWLDAGLYALAIAGYLFCLLIARHFANRNANPS